MSDMPVLEPCPFCGDVQPHDGPDALGVRTTYDSENGRWWVSCDTEDCHGNAVPDTIFETMEEAAQGWNTRTPTLHPERVDELAGWIKVKIRPGGETIIPATGYNGGVEAMARAIKRELEGS